MSILSGLTQCVHSKVQIVRYPLLTLDFLPFILLLSTSITHRCGDLSGLTGHIVCVPKLGPMCFHLNYLTLLPLATALSKVKL